VTARVTARVTPRLTGLPAEVAAVCTTFLDAVAGGLVTGLHLRGGVGFGEFVPGRSDIDFAAVLSRRPTGPDLDVLRAAHDLVAERHPAQPFDGLHLLADDLARDPDDCPDVPCVLHGWFEPEARYDVSPVAWHELALHSVPVLGELPVVWTDQGRLLEFTGSNLATYWADQAAALAKFPSEAAGDLACEWCVLGVARLHHLLVTGEMTTKSAAGRWGLSFYDERWHPVLREALRIREGAPGEGYADRGSDTAAFTAYVVGVGARG
jgi:hypothetical protein